MSWPRFASARQTGRAICDPRDETAAKSVARCRRQPIRSGVCVRSGMHRARGGNLARASMCGTSTRRPPGFGGGWPTAEHGPDRPTSAARPESHITSVITNRTSESDQLINRSRRRAQFLSVACLGGGNVSAAE